MTASGTTRQQLSALTLLLLVRSVSADPYPVNDRIDVEHYRFELVLSDDRDAIDMQARVDVRILDANVNELALDLVKRSSERDGRGMEVASVTRDGEALLYYHDDDVLRIDVPAADAADGRLSVTLRYSGVPDAGLVIGPNKHGDRTYFSDNWPNKARHWLATVDHIADKATSEFLVTAPSRLQVISNGLQVERSNLDSGRTLTHWKQSVPVSPWLYVVGAAEFAVQRVGEFDHKPIETWVYRQDREAGFYDFAVPTKEALAFYSSYVGPFEYEKLANVQSNSVGGGMEAASAILYGDKSVTGQRTRRWQTVIVHEVAHHWFGNSVTEATWDDVWLSEGFTTYFTYLYFEHANGQADFARYMEDARKQAFEFSAENPDYRVRHADLQDMANVTTRQIYQKGAWILHMLRMLVGDDVWWRGIQDYYRKYRNSTATTEDFQRVMETACGCELGDYFDYWLRTGSVVTLDGGWRYSNGKVRIDLERRGHVDGTPELTLEAAVYFADSPVPDIVSMPLTAEGASLEVDVPTEPVRILLDPNTRLLAEWTFDER